MSAVLGPRGQTTSRVACPAIAAAALVAAQQPEGTPLDSVYAPEQPIPPLPMELVTLAADALDRIIAPGSKIRELWDETTDDHPWHDEVAKLKAVLTPTDT
ncbi:DUF4259 domain-containing protein [Spirillospora sp. NPDC029432]|uniref:DUF4259 domain-containing protein n=1 Tax=Spirillospora sp. NPDC029432 TaxID=3154599 RepID=UPI0034557543